MKFTIPLSGKTVYTTMRECGYAPEESEHTQEFKFHRFLAGHSYPKFHIYCEVSQDQKFVTLNLHLDQKQPSYKGSHAHNAEYDGALVEGEAARIQSLAETQRNKF